MARSVRRLTPLEGPRAPCGPPADAHGDPHMNCPAELPVTGSGSFGIALIAVLLVGAGVVLLLVRRAGATSRVLAIGLAMLTMIALTRPSLGGGVRRRPDDRHPCRVDDDQRRAVGGSAAGCVHDDGLRNGHDDEHDGDRGRRAHDDDHRARDDDQHDDDDHDDDHDDDDHHRGNHDDDGPRPGWRWRAVRWRRRLHLRLRLTIREPGNADRRPSPSSRSSSGQVLRHRWRARTSGGRVQATPSHRAGGPSLRGAGLMMGDGPWG